MEAGNTHVKLVMVGNRSLFLNMKRQWHLRLVGNLGWSAHRGKPILLVGTKEDLRNDSVVIGDLTMSDCSPISYQKGLECARDIGAVKYVVLHLLTDV